MESKLRCIVIDDELHAVELISDYINNMPDMEVIKTFTNPLHALSNITYNDCTDFIFLDIDMPHMTGIELAVALRDKTNYLVFTTAHVKYAMNAFEVYADQFLLKPISMSKFALVVNQLIQNKPRLQEKEIRFDKDAEFFITTDQKNKLLKINPKDIIAIEGLDNYVTLHTTNGPVIAYFTMKELESKFQDDSSFIRVQRSFIVSRNFIQRVQGHMIHCTNGLTVPIGIKYKDAFFEYISSNTLRSNRK